MSMSERLKAIEAMRAYVESAGVPLTEFDPEFVVRMMGAMMVSFHKYGRVAQAYPVKFDAASDVRARMKKYRETGNKHFLVDAANFAMIEAMHPARSDATWGSNDAADSPGRTTASGHRLVQEDNDGNRIMGETILHIPEAVSPLCSDCPSVGYPTDETRCGPCPRPLLARSGDHHDA